MEAIREAEERRKQKHQKMEEERENMRQGIRDKVNYSKFCIFLTIFFQHKISINKFTIKIMAILAKVCDCVINGGLESKVG